MDSCVLQEIELVEYEIVKKDTDITKHARSLRNEQSLVASTSKDQDNSENNGVEFGVKLPEDKTKGLIFKIEEWTDMITGIHLHDRDTSVNLPSFDPATHDVHLIILTIPNGHNSGRAYVHRLTNDTAQTWIENVSRLVREAKRREHERLLDEQFGDNKFLRFRAHSKEFYESAPLQLSVAFLILLSFTCDMIEAQLLPKVGTRQNDFFVGIDITITTLFLLELLLNAFVHSEDNFKPFYSSAANWMDSAIVVVSLINVGLTASEEFPNAKLLRVLRLGRVVRLMTSLEALHKLIAGIQSSIYPVCNAFAILTIITCVYGVVGTHVFHERSEEYFGRFDRALFTMFQVLTGDSWASAVSRGLFDDGKCAHRVHCVRVCARLTWLMLIYYTTSLLSIRTRAHTHTHTHTHAHNDRKV